MRLVMVCGTAVPANWKLEIIFSLDKCLRSHESARASFVSQVMRKCLFCWAAPAAGLGCWSPLSFHKSELCSVLCSLFTSLWSIGYAFFVVSPVSQLNCHYKEYAGPAGLAHFYLSVITMCLILSHSPHRAPKSHKSRLAWCLEPRAVSQAYSSTGSWDRPTFSYGRPIIF